MHEVFAKVMELGAYDLEMMVKAGVPYGKIELVAKRAAD